MLSSHVFDLYRKPTSDDSINRVDSRTYLPFIHSFNNNDIIEITINRNDVWLLMYDAALIIEGTLQRTSGDGVVRFAENGPAFFFDSITYELNGVEIDHVKDPGIVSTLRAYCCYDEATSQRMYTAGWNYPNYFSINADGSFYIRMPLKHLLSVFNDYRTAMCGKHTIRLVRSRNDDNGLLIANGATKGKLTITNIELKVKHIVPNDELKINLLQSIRSDQPILIPYRKWELHELPALTSGAEKEIWSVKTTPAVECPRYVIVAFQTNRKDNLKENPTLFDPINVRNIKVQLNGEYFPYESMGLNFDKNKYAEAFHNYAEFPSTFLNCIKQQPLLTYSAFKNRTLFVIDCSRRDESLKSSTVDVKVEIEANDGFPANTRAYCIIIHDSIIEHLPLSEIVRKVN